MSAIANNTNTLEDTPRVTSISTNARVEYIMRFSKHAVLVVDNDSDIYSSIGNQFIGSLNDDFNAAFISLSPKLNDIQIRCRLVEQLFSDTLFDPEEPLAVTVLKLASDKKEPISIVIEHAHFLSLQLMHEFCQLADIAAKGDRCVNVLLLGEERAGQLITENTVVFNDKLSILNAADGQLIPNDSTMFSPAKAKIMLTPARKFALSIAAFTIACGVLIATFYQQDTFTFTNMEAVTAEVPVKLETPVGEPTVRLDDKVSTSQANPADVINALSMNENIVEQQAYAQPNEIMAALVNKPQIEAFSTEVSAEVNNEPETKSVTTEIIAPVNNANEAPSEPTIVSSMTTQEVVHSFAEEIDLTDTIKPTPISHTIAPEYYNNFSNGFVIQIVGFSTIESYQAFMNKYIEQEFTAYHRLLNGKKFFVVTSKVYPLKSDAKAAALLLPEELAQQGTWVKSINAVKSEIKNFNNTQ